MRIFSILLGVIALVISVLFWREKAPQRIIDFDKIQREEGGTLNIKNISRNISVVTALLAVLLLLAGISPVFMKKYFLLGTLVWAVIVCLDILWLRKSKFYRRK